MGLQKILLELNLQLIHLLTILKELPFIKASCILFDFFICPGLVPF